MTKLDLLNVSGFVLVEEMTHLANNVGNEEPKTATESVAFPKHERISRADHADAGPKVAKLVHRMIL